MEINRLKVYTAIFLFDKNYENVILLKRFAKNGDEAPMNSLKTGIGGKVDLDKNEANDIKSSVLREIEEETEIVSREISNIHLPISTIQIVDKKPDLTAVIYWFTGVLNKSFDNLECNEGELKVFKTSEVDNLVNAEKLTDAKYTLPWILKEKAYLSEETKTAVIDLKQRGMYVIEEGFFSPFYN